MLAVPDQGSIISLFSRRFLLPADWWRSFHALIMCQSRRREPGLPRNPFGGLCLSRSLCTGDPWLFHGKAAAAAVEVSVELEVAVEVEVVVVVEVVAYPCGSQNVIGALLGILKNH